MFQNTENEILGWEDFKTMNPCVIQAIFNVQDDYGWESPTPIQKSSIPLIIEGKNLIAQAESGSGKTLAFLCGALTICDPKFNMPQVLVISNTRESTIQNYEVFQVLNAHTSFSVGCALPTYESITKPDNQFIFGTIDTLKDELKTQRWSTNGLKLIIIDEANEIISRNFGDIFDLFSKRIFPRNIQFCLFSARLTCN